VALGGFAQLVSARTSWLTESPCLAGVTLPGLALPRLRSTSAFAWLGPSISNARLASMAPPMPIPTRATTSRLCKTARDALSVSRAVGAIGVVLDQLRGGPSPGSMMPDVAGWAAAGAVASIDQLSGIPSTPPVRSSSATWQAAIRIRSRPLSLPTVCPGCCCPDDFMKTRETTLAQLTEP
jgi:hypothetical protein